MDSNVIRYSIVVIFLWQIVCGVRISPKLDFGTDNTASDNSAKIRPSFQSKSFNYGDREHNKIQGVNIISCASGNCTVTDKQNGIGTDVVVHIKTKVEMDAKKNYTEAIPDIPIIIGTKGNEFPTYNPPPNVYNDLQNPFPISSLFRNTVQRTQPPLNSGSDYFNYASGYQGNRNGADLYPVYNEQNSNGNNPLLPQFTWNNNPTTRLNEGRSYNPLEFKKVNFNSWSGSLVRGVERNNPQQWRPCNCQNPQDPYYQSNYPQY